jgi:hypothetical protein
MGDSVGKYCKLTMCQFAITENKFDNHYGIDAYGSREEFVK